MSDVDEEEARAERLQAGLESLLAAGVGADPAALETVREALARFGRDAQRDAAAQCRLLAAPLDACREDLSDSGSPSSALAALEARLVALSPPGTLGEPPTALARLLRRLFGWLGLFDPQARYFRRLAGARGDLDRDIVALEQGRDRLRRDNITLQGDVEALSESVGRLAALNEHLRVWMTRVESALASEPRYREEPLKTHADDLQGMFTERALAVAEQLAVSQQAVMSLQLIVQNNERLMSAMERALNVSVSALIVADRAAQAVSGRALGLGEISSVGRRAGAAAGLIGEQSPKSLEQAFAGALSALDSVHELRRSGAEQVEGVQRTLAG